MACRSRVRRAEHVSHPSEGENLIAVVDKSLGLDPQLLPVPGHALEIPLDLGVTSVGDRAGCARVFDPFDPWVKEREQPVEVTATAAGKHRLHDLDVSCDIAYGVSLERKEPMPDRDDMVRPLSLTPSVWHGEASWTAANGEHTP